jgi:phosphoserine aminotransferase
MATPELEKEFLKACDKRGLMQLKGHRSVGGIRASVYNAMPDEGVDALVSLMKVGSLMRGVNLAVYARHERVAH